MKTSNTIHFLIILLTIGINFIIVNLNDTNVFKIGLMLIIDSIIWIIIKAFEYIDLV
jgi:hypothetical protein